MEKDFLSGVEQVFEKGKTEEEKEKDKLLRTIGELKVENDFKKKSTMRTLVEKRKQVTKTHPSLSVRKQCKILGINRSSFYHKHKEDTKLNLELMRLMDDHYLNHSYKGARRMHVWLTKDKDYKISSKRVSRLYYNVMGLRSVLRGPHTSKSGKGEKHQVYPYLLRVLKTERPNQVWATDITYIPMPSGFMYLVAIIDIYSRYLVGWSLSNTMDSLWCKQSLEEAIEKHGKP